MAYKSPFIVQRHFVSPLICEQVLDILDYTVPDVDPEGTAIMSARMNDKAEDLLFSKFQPTIPRLEQYYDLEVAGTERMLFHWYPEGSIGRPQCENSTYTKKKWLRTRNRDLTAVLFLSDYQSEVPFDSDYEVYGGKFEFPQHQFGFNPERGTLIIFPSVPHFINSVAPVEFGDLFLVKWHVAATQPYLYDPKKFPGDYTVWFKHLD